MLLANNAVATKLYAAYPDSALLRMHPPPLAEPLARLSGRVDVYNKRAATPIPPLRYHRHVWRVHIHFYGHDFSKFQYTHRRSSSHAVVYVSVVDRRP